MRYAVIADIHANLSAFRAVLRDIHDQKCTQIVGLGDIIGSYHHPKQCLDLIREMEINCVRGNFDETCASENAWEKILTPQAAETARWTYEQLTDEDRTWLKALPLVRQMDGFTLVHATLDQPHRWGYVFDDLSAAASFVHQTTDVCFFGHTHVPVAFISDGNVRGTTFSRFRIQSGKKYFINVGSVGQPRDNNNKAAYVIYDLAEKTVELRRIDYDRSDVNPPPISGNPLPVTKPPGGKPPHLSASKEFPKNLGRL